MFYSFCKWEVRIHLCIQNSNSNNNNNNNASQLLKNKQQHNVVKTGVKTEKVTEPARQYFRYLKQKSNQ